MATLRNQAKPERTRRGEEVGALSEKDWLGRVLP